MCGRFYLDIQQERLQEWLHLRNEGSLPDLIPRFNIAPSQAVAVVREGRQGRELTLMRWGLLPSWAKEEKNRFSMINARAETVADKPAYRNAFKQRRCLIPASGFFEWQQTAQGKQPYLIRRKNGEPMAFAGIWEHWEGGGKVVESCAIIVTDASRSIASLHDRMPVILAPEHFGQWLNGQSYHRESLLALLMPYEADELEYFAISKKINRPDVDEPSLLRALTELSQ